MKFTGERVIPGVGDADLFNEHRARYAFAQRYSAGKIVLDAACGTGYGSALLGENAKAVHGVDISPEAVEHARGAYGSGNAYFTVSDCVTLPFRSGQFDLVVAFEIIEHLNGQDAFLEELRRVLSPAGLLLLSTPNRFYYTDERGETNPFHTREFSFAEFEEILRPLFPHRHILFENHIPGLLISGPGGDPDFTSSGCGILQEKSAVTCEERERTAHYFLALCSGRAIDPVSPLLYLPSRGNVLREREIYIHRLTDYLAEAKAQEQKVRTRMKESEAELEQARARMEELDHLLEERTRWAASLDGELSEKNAEILRLNNEWEKLLEERTQWARDLDRQLAEKGADLLRLQAEFETRSQWASTLSQDLEQARAALQRLQNEFEERTAWALQLRAELEARQADLRTLYGSQWYRLGKTLHLSPGPPSDRR